MCIIACIVRIYPVPAHHLLTTTVKHRFLPVPSFSKCFTLTLFPPYFTPFKVLLHVCFVARPCLHPGRGGQRPPLLRPYSFTQGVPPNPSNASLSERHFKSSSTGQMGGFGLHASLFFSHSSLLLSSSCIFSSPGVGVGRGSMLRRSASQATSKPLPPMRTQEETVDAG